MTKEIKYEVKEKLGTLDSDSTMPKELRIISWNSGPDKYDIRGWKQDNDGNYIKMTKGITFDREELYSLYEILKELFEEEN